jgi:hypothetical protein
MNGKLVPQLSLFGLAMALATVFVVPSTVEPFCWLRPYTARLFQAVDVRDVRMVQRGERLRFAREPGQAIGIVRE